jgi:hypothetical protein
MKYFNASEFKAIGMMDKMFLDYLDLVREKYGKPFNLHCDYEIRAGMHGEGRAVDFHITDKLSLHDQAEKLIEICEELKLPFRLGAYQYWNSPGFHLDNKNEKLYWVLDFDKKYVYFKEKGALLDALEHLKYRH